MAPTVGASLMRALNSGVLLTGLTALRGAGHGALHLVFSNGLVISIIRTEGSYGNKKGEGLFEGAYWVHDGPISQASGWLTQEQAVEFIRTTHAEHGPKLVESVQISGVDEAEFIKIDLPYFSKGV